MAEFDGKSVLITGGGSGIGLATAGRLLSSGARVALAGRSEERLSMAAKYLDAGNRVLTAPTDVTSAADLDALVARVGQRFGRLHGVFASAGAGPLGHVAECDEAEFDRVMAVNLKGAFFTVQKALTLLGIGASVVLSTPMGAVVPNLAPNLAPDLARRGIRINTVTPCRRSPLTSQDRNWSSTAD
jgi:NAD(P)-dependent dehydrogenase (short-subunit alcohol dehydrogenase family)